MTTESSRTSFYDERYKQPNYFRHRAWIYSSYVSNLIRFCGLRAGNSILDVGCGQGFFSHLFGIHGLKVHGIDTSETGILTAANLYERPGVSFSLADAQTATFPEQFDCVFVRSCSLYNTDCFPSQKDVSLNLLRHVKKNGVFIFAYNSNFSARPSPTWRYHSLTDVKRHFSDYPDAQIFFLNKIMMVLVGRYSLSPLATRLSAFLSRVLGLGGDIVCVLRKY